MSNFDYAFTLIGLILGLSVAEILTGLVRTIRARRLGDSGWLTPFLGAIVICDLTTFWGLIADFRDSMPSLFQALGAGMIMTSLYYAAASLVFPSDPGSDLDAHFFRHKKLIVGLIILCNLMIFAGLFSSWTGLTVYVVNGIWLALAGALMVARGKTLSHLLLTSLLGFYVYVFVTAPN
jgi:hypothetical protein